ncbi:MAG: hypothetical protein E7487_09035 [Ruminococcaceae bacterium]|nr:hypothetical protein [Oscillospiraceae bacterium]
MERSPVNAMWVIRLCGSGADGLYLRTDLLDGEILAFQFEEQALRFMIRVKREIEEMFAVKLLCTKYEGDTRRIRFQKVSDSYIQETAAHIRLLCGC